MPPRTIPARNHPAAPSEGDRRVVFDSETTGSGNDDRIIEIGIVEVVGHRRTGREYLRRFNPEGRQIHWGAQRVHGIRSKDLLHEPFFRDCVDEMLDFIGGARLWAHSASFDARMFENELKRAGRPGFGRGRYVCTLMLAKKAWPDQQCGIDPLMERHMPGQRRGKHGALEDAQILADLMPRFVPALDRDALALANGGGSTQTARVSRSQAPRPAGPRRVPAYGSGMREGLAEAIARARDVTAAAALRTGGSDEWSGVTREQLIEVLSSRHQPSVLFSELAALDDKHADAALRWMCRGLPMELAIGRELVFMERTGARPAQDAPSMEP